MVELKKHEDQELFPCQAVLGSQASEDREAHQITVHPIGNGQLWARPLSIPNGMTPYNLFTLD